MDSYFVSSESGNNHKKRKLDMSQKKNIKNFLKNLKSVDQKTSKTNFLASRRPRSKVKKWPPKNLACNMNEKQLLVLNMDCYILYLETPVRSGPGVT